jgi:hypothetical protein
VNAGTKPWRRQAIRVTTPVILIAAVAAFFYFDLGRYLSLEALKANRDRLLDSLGGMENEQPALREN